MSLRETSKARATHGRRGTCAQEVWDQRTIRLSSVTAVAWHAALSANVLDRRGSAGAGRPRAVGQILASDLLWLRQVGMNLLSRLKPAVRCSVTKKVLAGSTTLTTLRKSIDHEEKLS